MVPVYDILNCGPRSRFVANGKLVHNSDKLNLQNLPSRGPNGKVLKKTIIAPEGHLLIDCDSSQIEARVLAWLAGQQDVLDAFMARKDVYIKMAARIYDKPESEVTDAERFIGKGVVLGCGYQMGKDRFKEQMQGMGVKLELAEADRIIKIYRAANHKIKDIWREAQTMIKQMAKRKSYQFGKEGVLKVDGGQCTIELPTGVKVRYADLGFTETSEGVEFHYKTRRGPNKIYGGKVIENVCQAIARCIIAEQMLLIDKKYKVAFTVHDSVIACIPEDEAIEAQQFVEDCMRFVPAWAHGLPLECESKFAKTYGDC